MSAAPTEQPAGTRPLVIREAALDGATDIAAALKLGDPRPVILLFGGADDLAEAVKPRLRWMLTRGVARTAAELGAAVIDGGTRAGVMEVMGAASADLGHRAPPLIGVAPAALVSANGAAPATAVLDPNHSHAVLTLGQQWGDERDTMLALAAVLARGKGVIAVVAGGGTQTVLEIREAVRRRWRVVVLRDTGGAADRLAPLVGTAPDTIADPVLAEIVRDGTLDVVPLDSSPDRLADPIRQEAAAGVTLGDAWQRFATLDANANRRQRAFRRMQALILVLGLAAAALAVTHEQLPAGGSGLRPGFRYLVLVIPIVLSVIVAGGNLFKPGSKWLLMRAAAEAIKREIFRYRTRAGAYRRADREQRLAQQIEQITNRLAQTEVNTTALRPYEGRIPPDMYCAGTDDGLSILSANEYVATRIADQTRYYERTLVRLHRALVGWQIAVLALGGLGTLLAALGGTVWVAVTTAAVSAITTYLGYRQIEMTITTYNQVRTDLANVMGWWRALPAPAKADPANVDTLVDHAEKVLELELAGWVQKMQDALAELRKAEEETPGENGKPAAGPKA
jgi:hypothetical protein